jgi:hypothetical protein
LTVILQAKQWMQQCFVAMQVKVYILQEELVVALQP